MGSSGSSAGSLCRSSQSWRTGLRGAGCCADAADAVSRMAAAALPARAMNSRLFMVSSRFALRRIGSIVRLGSDLSLNPGSVIVLDPELRMILFYELFDHRPA